jgi:hypothetical protein
LPALLLFLLVVAFVAFARTTTGMALGEPPESVSAYGAASMRWLAAVPLVLGMLALLLLGLWIPAGLDSSILHSIAAVT